MMNYDPNNVAKANGNFAGLPISEGGAKITYIPVSLDVTASHTKGTALGPKNVLDSSLQIDLFDENVKEAWNIARVFLQTNDEQFQSNQDLAREINELGDGYIPDELLNRVNHYCHEIHQQVYETCLNVLQKNQLLCIIGGDHSCAYGGIKAASEKFDQLDIIQFDAHMDLREAYEGFKYSHASIFYNVMEEFPINKLFALGIRDFSPMEYDYARNLGDRYELLTAQKLFFQLLEGEAFANIIQPMVAKMSKHVYLSVDVDALHLAYNRRTGTPVPGGLQYFHILYVVKAIIRSGRNIVGMDLCETAGDGYIDGFTSAKLIYALSNMAYLSNVH